MGNRFKSFSLIFPKFYNTLFSVGFCVFLIFGVSCLLSRYTLIDVAVMSEERVEKTDDSLLLNCHPLPLWAQIGRAGLDKFSCSHLLSRSLRGKDFLLK